MTKLSCFLGALGQTAIIWKHFVNLQRSSRPAIVKKKRPTIVYHVNFLLIFSDLKCLRLSLACTSGLFKLDLYIQV